MGNQTRKNICLTTLRYLLHRKNRSNPKIGNYKQNSAAGLIININKTRVIDRNSSDELQRVGDIQVFVDKFVYLGSIIA